MSCQFLARLASPQQADLSSDALHLSLQFALGPQFSDGAKLLIFSLLCFFSCCEDRKDDLQVLFMPKMELEASLCVYRGTRAVTPAQRVLPYGPLEGREMLIPGPRFLAGEMPPPSLLPSWWGNGDGCREHPSKRCGSQADHSAAAVDKPSSGRDSLYPSVSAPNKRLWDLSGPCLHVTPV